MNELMLPKDRYPRPRIALETRLPYRSFQAQFFPLPPLSLGDLQLPGIVKKYTTEPVYDGFFPFHIPEKRLAIMKREVAGMQTLAPEMGAELMTASFYGQSEGVLEEYDDTVIAMREVPHEDKLEVMLHEGRVPGNFPVQAAQRIALFHHASPICTPLDTELDTFFLRLMANEAGLLTRFYPERWEEVTGWYRQTVRFMNEGDNREALRVRSRLLGSPIDAHGDLKTDNMVMIDGKLNIHDSVPAPLWRANDPLMDLYFLIADLELKGHDELARETLQLYLEMSRSLREEKLPKGISEREKGMLDRSDELMVLLSRVYRFTIPFRLAKILNTNGTTVINGELAHEKLVKSYEALNV